MVLSSPDLLTRSKTGTLQILSVASMFPYPPSDGTRNRTWNLLERISRTQRVTLLTWADKDIEPWDLRKVIGSVDELILPSSGSSISGTARRLGVRARAMAQRIPPYVLDRRIRFENPGRLNHDFDVAIAEDDAALFLMPDVDCPVVVQRHNIYTETIGGLIQSSSLGNARKAKWLSEFGIWGRFDRQLSVRPNLSIVTTNEAKAALLRINPSARVEVVPNGVTIPETTVEFGSAPVAVFVGQMNYEPNVDAVVSFVRNIWPEIRRNVPGAEFRVIGRDPIRMLSKLDAAGVRILGEVADLHEACRGATLGVVPLNAGSGIKTKTLDLMAMGLPVLATPVGAEGLGDAEGHGLVIARDDDDFARTASQLLSDIDLSADLGQRARRFVHRYSWDESADKYQQLLAEIASARPPRSVPPKKTTAKTRVLFINGTGERAGAERMLVHLLSNLDRKLFEPSVAFLGKGPFVDEVAALGVRVIEIGEAGRLRQLRKWKPTIRAIRSAIAQTQAQIVHAVGEKMSIYAGRAAAAEGIPCIAWLHDAPGAGGLSGLLAQAALRRTPIERIVTCARWMEEDFNAKLRLGASAIPNCLDLPSLPGPNDSMGQIKAQAEWGPDVMVISHFARLQRWKGTEVFLRSAARIASANENVRFLVVGDALFGREIEYRLELHELAAQLGLEGKLIFTGFRNDALEIMAESDVVVHSSIEPDPFPLVVLEGMALGRPVVASRTRGPEEAIEDGVTGLLTPPRDVEALTDALSRLIESPELRESLGNRAYRQAQKRFSAPLMAYRFESLYQTILEDAPSAAFEVVPALSPAEA